MIKWVFFGAELLSVCRLIVYCNAEDLSGFT